METKLNGTTISLIKGDITRQNTEAIVNAANSSLMGGGGVDGAIHRAGGPEIVKECKKIVDLQGRLPAGKAVITTGGKLKARHVIHTVGPVWRGGDRNEAELLASAYEESLKIAIANGLKTVSFPSISTGAYGYPVYQAAEVALRTVLDFLKAQPAACLKKVVFVLFDPGTYQAYEEALQKLDPSATPTERGTV